jgi:hypothetical protein
MLKAVVFYMALMLPFCFFMQRLLFKTVRIEAQMGIFMALFVLTYAVFRTIHPAFVVAQAPEAMFVAFVMGALALCVIKILHGRFEGEMQLLFRTYTGMDTAGIGYSTVGQQAMLIGVNNMKRRRVRTALTTATIVLVTFTMLAFTSVSRTLSPTLVANRRAWTPCSALPWRRTASSRKCRCFRAGVFSPPTMPTRSFCRAAWLTRWASRPRIWRGRASPFWTGGCA